MEQEYFKNFDAFGKNAFEATRDLIAFNSNIIGKVLDGQRNIVNLMVEGSEKQVKLAEQANDPQVYLKEQSALYEEYAGKFAGVAEEGAKLAQGFGEELKGFFEQGLANADKAGKAVVKTAAKSTKKAA
jgi:hypothetical protein